MPKIRFQAKLTAIGSQAILRLPQAASSKLPSRGMSIVEGTLNGRAFQAPLEPDGGLLLQPQSMHRPFDVAQRRASRTNARHRRVRGAAGHIEKNLTHSMLAVHAVCSGCGALLSLSETLDAVGDLRSFVAFVRKLCDREGEGL